jgi:hypothetical protein
VTRTVTIYGVSKGLAAHVVNLMALCFRPDGPPTQNPPDWIILSRLLTPVSRGEQSSETRGICIIARKLRSREQSLACSRQNSASLIAPERVSSNWRGAISSVEAGKHVAVRAARPCGSLYSSYDANASRNNRSEFACSPSEFALPRRHSENSSPMSLYV